MTGDRWPPTAHALEALQADLAVLATRPPPWCPEGPFVAAGAFVAFEAPDAWAAVVALTGAVELAASVVHGRAAADYHPGHLALREGALLERAYLSLPAAADVLLVNATGLDHPRGAGLALHLGWVLDVPTVGVTDRTLVADGPEPGPRGGDRAPLVWNGRVVAVRVRTRTGVRPVVVHAGWRTDPDTAADVVLAAGGRARTPEPIRRARRLARTARATEARGTAQRGRGRPGTGLPPGACA